MSLNWEIKKRIYLLFIYIGGFSITLYALGKIDKNFFLEMFIWVVIATLFEIKPVVLNDEEQFTLSFTIHFALLIIYGPWAAIVIAFIATTFTEIYRKVSLIKLGFNVGQFSITLYLTGIVFSWLKTTNEIFVLPDDIPAFLVSSIVYMSTNLLLVAIVVALYQRRNIIYVLKGDLRMVMLHYIALVPMGMLMVLLCKEQPLAMILIVPPLALAHTSFRNYMSLREETRQTLEVLADIIDRRDPYTAEHSKRVARYSVDIADEMGLDDSLKEIIHLAGKVHDLGKVAVSDGILLKAGRLTNEEMEKMKLHPIAAYDILNKLKIYKAGSVIVRAHHERYDGLGYPYKIHNEKIPIGARIMAVADSYDAMTTDRPYRKAMTIEQAVSELRRNAGTQFDPSVVDAFIRVLLKKEDKQRECLQQEVK